jgi:hypothetical protein
MLDLRYTLVLLCGGVLGYREAELETLVTTNIVDVL